MAKTVFDKILDTVTGFKSYNWYKNEVSKITTIDCSSTYQSRQSNYSDLKFGVMNLFGYDSKFKATLPLYDRFPLILPLDVQKVGSMV